LLCKVCGQTVSHQFSVKILNKYVGDYYKCSNCLFLFAGDPFWLKEAYKNPINLTDTGLVNRNISFHKILSVLIYLLYDRQGRFLDYAGGYGIFTRLMRDTGFDFYWYDLYCENLMAKGFEYDMNLNEKIEVLTAFEVLEHLENPIPEIEKMLTYSHNIILSTELLPFPIPDPENFWYYGFDHGQHISFYSPATLIFIARKFGLNYYNLGSLHLFTPKIFSLIYLKSLKKTAKLLYPFIKLNMKSRMFDDHLKLKNS
jgi:hypothetical protein